MPLRPATFAWAPDEVRRVGYATVDLIAAHLSALPERPVFIPYPQEGVLRGSEHEPPTEGEPADDVLDAFARDVAPYPFGNGHPRFFGWVNSPPSPIAIFAEALAAAMNPSVAGGNHAAVHVERQVVGWFRAMFGLPASAMGLFVSGGSTATLTALAAARHLATEGTDRQAGLARHASRLVVYQGEEGHGCIQKAVELLGLGSENLRRIPSDGHRRMRVDALEAAIRADLDAGRRPMAIVASAGTVNTGAIDPLAEIAETARRLRVWLHVDGAYGAPAILTGRYRDELAAIGEADSLAVDPHKWLSIPVEAAIVLVRDAEALRSTFSLVPPYLQTDGDISGVGGPPWFSEFGFAQTRGFAALKVWMAMRHHGVAGYRASIEADLWLAHRLAELVAADPEFELVGRGLSAVCFRVRPRGVSEAELDDHNRQVLERVQLGGEAFLSGTTLDGAFALRACFVNHRTRADDLSILMQALKAASAAVVGTITRPESRGASQ